jgi:ubiquinone/menaquinone biosynthesis C-methylase UbiE
MFSRTLQRSYTLMAPLYDSVVAAATQTARQRSLAQLGSNIQNHKILLAGIGTGLDIPYLPEGARYAGIDLTYAMLKRAQKQITTQNISLHQGDIMQLPYPDEFFEVVIMHLILAVVPVSQLALDEATRVLAPNGKILIFDKFLQPHQKAPLRRLFSPVISKIATRTDVVFEELEHPNLTVVSDTPALMNGWFRHILLRKNG